MKFKCPNCGSEKLWMFEDPENLVMQSEVTELRPDDFLWCYDCDFEYQAQDGVIQEQIVDGRLPI